MNGGKNKGYTIIEVMLFLAISGFMFVTAAIFINGKQANAEFKQGINDANTQIRTVMNDVLNGFYPTNSDFKCTAGSSGVPVISTLTTLQQGQNLGCVFIGKVIQFGVNGSGDAISGWTGYRIYSVAGRQYASGTAGQPPAGFSEAKPVAINIPSVVENNSFHWGVSVTHICSPAPVAPAKCTSVTPGAVGFFGGFGSFDSSNTLQSGSQSVNVALVPSSKLNDSDELSHILNLSTSGSVLPSPNILICFQGSKGKVASITIGGTYGQQLASTIKIQDSRC